MYNRDKDNNGNSNYLSHILLVFRFVKTENTNTDIS